MTRCTMIAMALCCAVTISMMACGDKPASGGGTTTTTSTGGGAAPKTGGGTPAAAGFKYDMWEAWNSFKEGSSVTMETEAMGNKTVMTTTIEKKEAERIGTKMTMEVAGQKIENPSEVKKPGTATGSAECPQCKKAHKSDSKESKDSVEVGGKKLDCVVMDMTASDCEGKEAMKSKTWYCKEVPGWIVKMEMTAAGNTTKQTCTAFEKK